MSILVRDAGASDGPELDRSRAEKQQQEKRTRYPVLGSGLHPDAVSGLAFRPAETRRDDAPVRRADAKYRVLTDDYQAVAPEIDTTLGRPVTLRLRHKCR